MLHLFACHGVSHFFVDSFRGVLTPFRFLVISLIDDAGFSHATRRVDDYLDKPPAIFLNLCHNDLGEFRLFPSIEVSKTTDFDDNSHHCPESFVPSRLIWPRSTTKQDVMRTKLCDYFCLLLFGGLHDTDDASGY